MQLLVLWAAAFGMVFAYEGNYCTDSGTSNAWAGLAQTCIVLEIFSDFVLPGTGLSLAFTAKRSAANELCPRFRHPKREAKQALTLILTLCSLIGILPTFTMDTFHEVRRKRDKKKENTGYKDLVESRKHPDDLRQVTKPQQTLWERSSWRGNYSRNTLRDNPNFLPPSPLCCCPPPSLPSLPAIVAGAASSNVQTSSPSFPLSLSLQQQSALSPPPHIHMYSPATSPHWHPHPSAARIRASSCSHPYQCICHNDLNLQASSFYHLTLGPAISKEFRVVRDNRVNQKPNGDAGPLLSQYSTSIKDPGASVPSRRYAGGNLRCRSPGILTDGRHSDARNSGRQFTFRRSNVAYDSAPGHARHADSHGIRRQASLEETVATSTDSNLQGQGQKQQNPPSRPTTSASNRSVVGVYSWATDPVHVPSPDSRTSGAVGAIKREVGVVGVRRQSSEQSSARSSVTSSSFSMPHLGKDISPSTESFGQSSAPQSVMADVSVNRSFLGHQYHNKLHQQTATHQKVILKLRFCLKKEMEISQPNMEWKPKSSQKSGPSSPGAIGNVAAPIPLSAEQCTTTTSPAEETQMVEKLSQVKISENQHVIIPPHLRVPESDRSQLTFGSFGAGFDSSKGFSTGIHTFVNVLEPKDEPAVRTSTQLSGHATQLSYSYNLIKERAWILKSIYSNFLGSSVVAAPCQSFLLPLCCTSYQSAIVSFLFLYDFFLPFTAASAVVMIKTKFTYFSGSISLSTAVTSSEEVSGGDEVDLLEDQVRPSSSESQASEASNENLQPDKKEPTSPQDLGNFANVGLVQSNSSPFNHPEMQQQQDLQDLPSFQAYTPQNAYDVPFLRSSIDENVQGQRLSSPQEGLSSHVANNGAPSSAPMVQQQAITQLYPQVHIPHFPNFVPYRQVLSPFYVPPVAVPNYSGNPAYPPPPNGSSYLLMPGGSSHLTTSGLKYSASQYKPVPASGPMGYGSYTNPAGYTISGPGAVGGPTGLDDSSRIKYKESNLYVPNPQAVVVRQAETSDVWIQTPRELPNMQSSPYYNLSGQGPHAAYVPSHTGHASFNGPTQSAHVPFPGLYHPPQPTAIANPHLVHQPLPGMGSNVSVAAAGGQVGTYQQPQLGHLNWTANF
ncbi:hypothetical protein ACLOJK_006422 [Asimina triloba]